MYSWDVPSFTIQVVWSDDIPYLKDSNGQTVNCIYTEGTWTKKALWTDNGELLAGMEGISSPIDLLNENELSLDNEC